MRSGSAAGPEAQDPVELEKVGEEDGARRERKSTTDALIHLPKTMAFLLSIFWLAR